MCVKREKRDPPSPRRTPQSDGLNCTNPTKSIEKSRPSDQSRSRRVKPHFPSHQSDTEDPSYFGAVLRNPNLNPNPSPWSGSPSSLRPWRRRRPWRTSRLTSSWRRTPLTSSDPERFDPSPLIVIFLCISFEFCSFFFFFFGYAMFWSDFGPRGRIWICSMYGTLRSLCLVLFLGSSFRGMMCIFSV